MFILKFPIANVAFVYWFLRITLPILLYLTHIDGSLKKYVTLSSAIFFFVWTFALFLSKAFQNDNCLILRLPTGIKLIVLFFAWAGICLFLGNKSFDTEFSSLLQINFRMFSAFILVYAIIETVTYLLMCQLSTIKEIAHSTLKGICYGAVFLALFLLVENPKAGLRLGIESVVSPTGITLSMCIGIFSSTYLYIYHNSKNFFLYIGTVGLLFFTLLFGLGKTSILAFLLSALFFFNMICITGRQKFILFGISLLIFCAAFSNLVSYFDFYTTGDNYDGTLSGRIYIWDAAIGRIVASPFFGYGPAALVTGGIMGTPGFPDYFPHAHNEALEMLLQYGLPGLLITLSIYIYFLTHLLKSIKNSLLKPQTILALTFFIFFFINSIFSSVRTDLFFPIPLIILFTFWTQKKEAVSLRNSEFNIKTALKNESCFST